jgi:hypothetical protein
MILLATLLSLGSVAALNGASFCNLSGEELIVRKHALQLLVMRPDGVTRLAEVGLPTAAQESVVAAARREAEGLARLRWETRDVGTEDLLLEGRSPDAARMALVGAWNDGVAGLGDEVWEELRDALAIEDVERLVAWVEDEFVRERGRADALGRRSGVPPVRGEALTYTVFATQYLAETNYEVALPDWKIKFANRDWSHEAGYERNDYQVRLVRGGYTVPQVIVWDVGPYNIDDNYWNAAGGSPRPRRLFTDLPQGMPEAQAAYYDNYNGGLDQYGRVVVVPTALDLAPAVAADLGLAYLENDWITVTYLWEEEGGGAIVVDDSSSDCIFVGPSQYWWEVFGLGNNGQMHYTWNIPAGYDNAAAWTFRPAQSGQYELAVFIPNNYATTRSARYYLNVGSGWQGPVGTVDQAACYDEWVGLGVHWLPSAVCRLAVIDGTGEPEGTTMVGVDAARAVPTW